MKKMAILLIAAIAILSFSCTKYCTCNTYIDGELDKNSKNEFVKESSKECDTFGRDPYIEDGKTYEVKCK